MTAPPELHSKLPAVLGPALGLDGADVTIEHLRVSGVAVNRTIFAFDAVTPHGRRALSLYLGPDGVTKAGMEREARAQAAAAAAGAPVPPILVASDSLVALGNPFLICDAVKGETGESHIIHQLDRADRQAGGTRLLRQCAQALAAIHRADADDPQLASRDPVMHLHDALDALNDTSATFAWAIRWLSAHRPALSPAVLVHGDYRLSNLLIDGSDLTAVLTWGMVHVGEAYEDLARFCIRASRLGAPASLGAGGLGSIESFLCAYEEASATTVDRVSFHWWLALSTLRWGVTSRILTQARLTEQVGSAAVATLGHRVCEAEWDVLNLLDPARPGGASMTSGKPLHGRPTAVELVAMTAGFLETDVLKATTGQLNVGVKTAAHTLRTVQHSLLATVSADARAALAALGFTNEAQLTAAIRNGDLDHRADDVTACLRSLVQLRLAFAHPGYDSE